MKIKSVIALCLSAVLPAAVAIAENNAKKAVRIDPLYRATKPVEKHFESGLRAMHEKDWTMALQEFQIVTHSFPCSSFAPDALYYTGVAYFNLGDYEFANRVFSTYLKEQSVPKYFDEVFCFKFAIAENFRKGAGKHLFGIEKFPRWMPATEEAIELYDEIATTLPNDELAPRALYSKGFLLREMKDYKGSIEAIQTLIRRYPKDALSAAGYLLIATDYCYLSRCEPNNPDLLALALINIRRFGQDFPGDARVNEALKIYCHMEELYACGLYEMGRFYERTCHPNASIIYYIKTIREFPDTKIAAHARTRLTCLDP